LSYEPLAVGDCEIRIEVREQATGRPLWVQSYARKVERSDSCSACGPLPNLGRARCALNDALAETIAAVMNDEEFIRHLRQ